MMSRNTLHGASMHEPGEAPGDDGAAPRPSGRKPAHLRFPCASLRLAALAAAVVCVLFRAASLLVLELRSDARFARSLPLHAASVVSCCVAPQAQCCVPS